MKSVYNKVFEILISAHKDIKRYCDDYDLKEKIKKLKKEQEKKNITYQTVTPIIKEELFNLTTLLEDSEIDDLDKEVLQDDLVLVADLLRVLKKIEEK